MQENIIIGSLFLVTSIIPSYHIKESQHFYLAAVIIVIICIVVPSRKKLIHHQQFLFSLLETMKILSFKYISPTKENIIDVNFTKEKSWLTTFAKFILTMLHKQP